MRVALGLIILVVALTALMSIIFVLSPATIAGT